MTKPSRLPAGAGGGRFSAFGGGASKSAPAVDWIGGFDEGLAAGFAGGGVGEAGGTGGREADGGAASR
jgi:hypothetical protein